MSFLIFLAVFLFFMKADFSLACMTILVGKKASESGEILVGHNEDAPGRFVMQTHLVKKERRKPGTKIKFEPDLSEVELFNTRNNLFWSEAKTFNEDFSASAFCDFFVNGYGVVICSNNCEYSKEDSPELLNGGIGYGFRRLIAEKSHCAKEAVDIACNLIEKYGYSSSGRSYAFSDKDEIFVLQVVNGKHYAVSRVPDDEVAVIPNHYTIRESEKNSRGYKELINYAVKRGWYKEGEIFDFSKVYQADDSFGLEKNTFRHVKAFEILLNMDLDELLKTQWQSLPFSIKPAQKVNIDTLKKILREHHNSHFEKPISICNCDTLESNIVQIRYNPERIILRRALGRPCNSVYIPWYFGITAIPEGYEDINGEKALSEHFRNNPDDMNYKNNAWFRAMELQAACDILGDEKVHDEIKKLESKFERELKTLDSQLELRFKNKPDIAHAMIDGIVRSFADEVKDFTLRMKKSLNIFTGEAENSVIPGKNFSVRIPKFINSNEIDISKCKCGTSYTDKNKWSKCIEINPHDDYLTLVFETGKWVENAVPCFTDLYITLSDLSGKIFAGSVKISVRS